MRKKERELLMFLRVLESSKFVERESVSRRFESVSFGMRRVQDYMCECREKFLKTEIGVLFSKVMMTVLVYAHSRPFSRLTHVVGTVNIMDVLK